MSPDPNQIIKLLVDDLALVHHHSTQGFSPNYYMRGKKTDHLLLVIFYILKKNS